VPSPTTYSNSGVRLTVNEMLKDPLLIRARVLQMMNQQFIMETLLRRAPAAEAGVILYHESTPLFTDDDASVIAEAAEIPLVQGQDGVPKAAFTIKTGLGIEITIEMKNRNRIDLVNVRMNQVKNTILRHWERRLFTALDAAVPAGNIMDLGPTVATTGWWNGSAPKIRENIIDATQLVREAVVPGQGTDAFLGFEPDTIVISTRTASEIMKDTDFRKVYEGSPLASTNPFYTGQLEKQALGLNWITSRFMSDDVAYLLEKNTVGGYSDERPLNVSPTYPDQDREVWRSNVVRQTGIFIDQPYAIAKIANIKDA
jgi:hypothetical protein